MRIVVVEFMAGDCIGGDGDDCATLRPPNLPNGVCPRRSTSGERLCSEVAKRAATGACFPRERQRDIRSCTSQVVLLDHGLYVTLDTATRDGFRNLWKAMVLKNDIELRT